MKIHHIGFVVQNIEQYEKRFIHNGKINEVEDVIQNAKLALYNGFGDYFLELIEPLNENSFTWNFLKKTQNSFHHLCYEIDSFDSVIKFAKEHKLIHLLGPVKATLFNDKNVVFYFDRNRNIVEFLLNKL